MEIESQKETRKNKDKLMKRSTSHIAHLHGHLTANITKQFTMPNDLKGTYIRKRELREKPQEMIYYFAQETLTQIGAEKLSPPPGSLRSNEQ